MRAWLHERLSTFLRKHCSKKIDTQLGRTFLVVLRVRHMNGICATTIVPVERAHMCIANVRFEMVLSMQRTFFFFFPRNLLLDAHLFSTKFFMHISIYIPTPQSICEKQEITAAIQFINCKWKLNMQRNFFFSLDSICFWCLLMMSSVCCSDGALAGEIWKITREREGN